MHGDRRAQFKGDGLVFEYSGKAPGGVPMWTVRCVLDGRGVRAAAPSAVQAWNRAIALAGAVRRTNAAGGA